MNELEQILYHLEQMQAHREAIEEINQSAWKKVQMADRAQEELLHLIESQKPSGSNMLKTYSKLRHVRTVRRNSKDIIYIVKCINAIFSPKVIQSAIKSVSSNTARLSMERKYTSKLSEEERRELYGE